MASASGSSAARLPLPLRVSGGDFAASINGALTLSPTAGGEGYDSPWFEGDGRAG